ncbi:hypothetical protein CDAR_215311 [Caerostris darwini]|uniref:Histamine N-methyltransferase n=1 Tax=Caerostris darwini TaxID=1538125 RepID=A0AAV4U7D5_9ARAC|nr:hypothetical protein CDAR_215311 [Caerostris darwini]
MEYHEADITKSSSLVAWKGKITKFISCYSFNGLKTFDEAFENVFDLLVPNGTAAIYFTLNTSYCTYLDEIIKKWLKLDGIPSYQGVPAVQQQNLDAQFFEALARKVGFDVVFCESFLQNMYFVTDAEFIAFFDVVCPRGLATLLKEAFQRDLIDKLRKNSERNNRNKVTFKRTVLKMMLRKPVN